MAALEPVAPLERIDGIDILRGLGLFGRLSIAAALAIGLGVYAVQVAFSAWWLARYRYGSVEWLWRTLMYGKRRPMTVA